MLATQCVKICGVAKSAPSKQMFEIIPRLNVLMKIVYIEL